MRAAAVIGTGQTRYAASRDDMNTCELVREATALALGDAGLKPSDIDAVVIGSGADMFEGMSQSEHWTGPATGAVGKPVMRVQAGGTAGAAATIAAFHQVVCGAFDIVLAISYQKLSELIDGPGLSLSYDPVWDSRLAMPLPVLGALQSRQYLDRHSRQAAEEHGAMVVSKNRANALLNPRAHLREAVTIAEVMASRPVAEPLKKLDCCPRSDGAAAILVASEKWARKACDRPAWIVGTGTCSESRYVPHVDLAYPESCVRAAQQAYQTAWVYDPPAELDVAEVFEAFSFQELIWCEALGLCRPGEGARMISEGVSSMEGPIPVNPSGGVLSANPIAAAGMARQAEAAMQVMGRAGEHQVPGARKALAHSWGGALQLNTVTIFSSEL